MLILVGGPVLLVLTITVSEEFRRSMEARRNV